MQSVIQQRNFVGWEAAALPSNARRGWATTLRSLFRSSHFRAIVFLALAPFIYYWPAALGLKTFFSYDIHYLFYPIRFELARRLAEGALPFWSTTMHGGFPLLAEGQVGALYPLNWILYRFLPLHVALSYSLLPHLALAGVGMYLFLRTQTARASAAFVGALSFYFSGFFVAKIQHMTNMIAAGWMPWLFFCYEKFTRARDGRARRAWFAAISGIAALMLLNGHPQLDFMAVSLFGLWVLFASLTRVERSIRVRVQEIALVVLALALGAGIASVQLVPFVELFPFSIRGETYAAKEWASYSLDPERFIQIVSPFAIEGPFDPNIEFFGYAGMLPLALAATAIATRRDKRVWFWVAIVIVALALALGNHNPFYQLLYNVPIFNRFRVPARFLLWFIFAIAFLAALALDQLVQKLDDDARARRVSKWIASAFGGLIVGAFLSAHNATWELWLDAWHLLPYIFGAVAVLLLVAAWTRKIAASVFIALAVGLTIFDLTCFVAPFLFTTSGMVSPAEMNPVPRSVRAMESTTGLYRVLAYRDIQISDAAARASLQPTLPTVYNKEGFDNYIGLPLGRNNFYHETMSPAMFNLANIRYYLYPLEPPADPVFLGKKLLPASEPSYGLNLDALTRAVKIPPTRAAQIEVISYTDDTANLENGFRVGELELGLEGGGSLKFPIRLGIETADWAYEGLAIRVPVKHDQPTSSIPFTAYLSSVGREFQGRKYVAHFALSANAAAITSIRVTSNLSGAGLTIERINLIDADGKAQSVATLAGYSEFALAFRSHTVAMWENLTVMPRAFIVHRAELADDTTMLTRMWKLDFDPRRVVLLAEGVPLAASEVDAARENVEITEYKPERVVLNVLAESRGYVILADSWYPGWEATVDGRTATIHRADFIFRAVEVDAGEHRVEFVYRQMSFMIGAAISAVSMMVVIGIVAMRRQK
jgi:hypothetical protein